MEERNSTYALTTPSKILKLNQNLYSFQLQNTCTWKTGRSAVSARCVIYVLVPAVTIAELFLTYGMENETQVPKNRQLIW